MKTALITGASRGLGRELSKTFLTNNYKLILNSREIEPSENPKIETIKGDLHQEITIDSLTRCAKDNDVDILINNAGIYLNKSVFNMSDIEYRNMLDINLYAPMRIINGVWPIFKNKKSGLIININSLAGKYGSSGESAYAASKFGLRGLSQSLQLEGIKYNIKIINIFLGAMKTDMTKHRNDSNNLIDPVEVADLIIRLCKDYKTLNIPEIEIRRSIY